MVFLLEGVGTEVGLPLAGRTMAQTLAQLYTRLAEYEEEEEDEEEDEEEEDEGEEEEDEGEEEEDEGEEDEEKECANGTETAPLCVRFTGIIDTDDEIILLVCYRPGKPWLSLLKPSKSNGHFWVTGSELVNTGFVGHLPIALSTRAFFAQRANQLLRVQNTETGGYYDIPQVGYRALPNQSQKQLLAFYPERQRFTLALGPNMFGYWCRHAVFTSPHIEYYSTEQGEARMAFRDYTQQVPIGHV